MKLIVALPVAAFVGGCASLPPMQKAQSESLMVCDYAQMARVDRVALAQRTEVIWVNCPLVSRDRVKSS